MPQVGHISPRPHAQSVRNPIHRHGRHLPQPLRPLQLSHRAGELILFGRDQVAVSTIAVAHRADQRRVGVTARPRIGDGAIPPRGSAAGGALDGGGRETIRAGDPVSPSTHQRHDNTID